MSEQSRLLLEAIRDKLRAAIRRATLAELVHGALLAVGLLAAVFFLLVAIEAGFWLDTTPRSLLFWLLMAVAVVSIGWGLGVPLLRFYQVLPGWNEESMAQHIGRHFPAINDRLVNLLHLAEGRTSKASPLLVDGAVRMIGAQVQPLSFEEIEQFERARRVGKLVIVPVVALLLFLILAPMTFTNATDRLLSPGAYFARPAPFALQVQPQDIELVKGDSLQIEVIATGEALPATIEVQVRNEGEDRLEPVTLAADADGRYRHTVVNVRQPLRYRVEAAPVQSPWYDVRVTERPLVRGLQVGLTFPRYAALPPRRLDPNVGDITGLPGTSATVAVSVGGDALSEAALVFDDDTRIPLRLDGPQATGAFTLTREGQYHIEVTNAQGFTNRAPIVYTLRLLRDERPTIVLLDPPPTADLDETLSTQLRARLTDDYGFNRLALFYRLAESRFGTPQDAFTRSDLPVTPDQLDQDVQHPWLLVPTGLDLVPGDVVEYYLQVWDNDTYSGYKSAKSATHRLRLPSLAEQYEQLEEEETAAQDELEDLMQESSNVRETFEQLRDELRRKPEADWEDQRQLEKLMEQEQALEQRVEDFAQQVEEITDQMQQNDLVDPETLEKFQELQRVADEINSPELMEALKKLQEAMQQMDLQQMQEQMQDFQFNEQQYRERMERTLELFKKLVVEQKLDEASKRLDELAKQQEQLAEQSSQVQQEQQEDRALTPEEQAALEQQLEALQQQLEETQQALDENAEQRRENLEAQTSAEQQQAEQQKARLQQEAEALDEQREQLEQQAKAQREQMQQARQQQQDPTGAQREKMAQEQERAQAEMEQVEELVKETAEKMEDMKNAPKQQMEQMQQQMEQQDMPQQMEQNAQQMRQNQMQQSQQQQQQMQQQMQQMSQQMQQMQQQMQQQQQQVNAQGLRRALDDVLTLSREQESLREQVRALPGDNPALRQMAQQQVELSEGLAIVGDSLQSLAKDIPQMSRQVQKHAGEALRDMQQSVEQMAERQPRPASGHQKSAMTNLNDLALMLSDLLDQMMNGQSGGSGSGMSMQQMLQQMQQMSQQQQQLNQQLQQMLNDAQGNKLSQSQQQRLEQMARQQQSIQQQLQQLAKEKALQNDVLGDLNRIAEQMQETIDELRGRQEVGRETVQRQQQILNRLLDAQKSMNKRGRENKREGQTGNQGDRTSPPALTPSEKANQLRRDLIRALESGYAADYEELIKRYFELLQEKTGGDGR